MASTEINLAEQVSGVLPIAEGGTGNTSGAAVSAGVATKLATARTLQANLASTGTGSFDGSANTTLGVTGILPIANGGTGNTTGAAASCTGNAATATQLQSGAQINGVNFTGASAITVNPVANSVTSAMIVDGTIVAADISASAYGTAAGTICQGNDSRVVNALQNEGGATGMWFGATSSLPTTGVAGILYVETS